MGNMGLVEETIQRKYKDIALVIPSIRAASFKRFIDEWHRCGLFKTVDLILIEDNPTRTIVSPNWISAHVSWKEMDDEFLWAKQIIPRRSDTIRSFGYWLAWKAGYEHTMTLDDDCYPDVSSLDLIADHLNALKPRTRWFNTLKEGDPRGLPYKNRGEQKIVLNHGLWTNVLDMDAPHQLVAPFEDGHDMTSTIVPNGMFFPMCGMSLCWRSEITVLLYHLLMGKMKAGSVILKEKCAPPDRDDLYSLPYDRFGDIHCGILLKKICDYLRLGVTTGVPYIHHDRASDPFTNLVKEANGIKVNEIFWERVDEVQLTGKTPVSCYIELGEAFEAGLMDTGIDYPWYFRLLGSSMKKWADLFVQRS